MRISLNADPTRTSRIESIQNYTNYYAFGGPQPGRYYNAPGYHFGFNGQEKDDALLGDGAINHALNWEYDTRLGRRFNRDPIDQINISNYAAFGDNPVLNSDVLGNAFHKAVTEVFEIPVLKTTSDLGHTAYNIDNNKPFSISYNNEKSEYDLNVNVKINYNQAFIKPYNSNGKDVTLDNENPGLLDQTKAHERGHAEQQYQAAQQQIEVSFSIGGEQRAFKGDANQIVNDVAKAYITNGLKNAGQEGSESYEKTKAAVMNDFIENQAPVLEDAIGGALYGKAKAKLDAMTKDARENDANEKAKETLGVKKLKYGTVKYQGKDLPNPNAKPNNQPSGGGIKSNDGF